MNSEALVLSILKNKEIEELPSLVERGGLPALVSGLSHINRVHLAAALYETLNSGGEERPLFVICPDDTTAESFSGDLSAFLGIPAPVLGLREEPDFKAEAVSRESERNRIETFWALLNRQCNITVASAAGLIQKCIPQYELENSVAVLEEGGTFSPEELEELLYTGGYTKTDMVEGSGQFARRGGILDIFSPGSEDPLRLEFWGDEIDSMGFFDVSDQRRKERVESFTVLPASESPKEKNGNTRNDIPFACAVSYIPENAFVFIDQPKRCGDFAKAYIKDCGKEKKTAPLSIFKDISEDFPLYMADSFTTGNPLIAPKTLTGITARQLPGYAGNAQQAADDVRSYMKQGYGTVILTADERRAESLRGFFAARDLDIPVSRSLKALPESGRSIITTGSVSSGTEYPGIKLAILTDSQLIRRNSTHIRRAGTKKALPKDRVRIEAYTDLSAGDYVVHENYGIGRFDGIVKMAAEGGEKDYIKINYRDKDVLYVPATSLDLVTKYTGAGEDSQIKLSKLGSAEWAKTRIRAKKSARDMADKLITLYAGRLRKPGYAFLPDTEWQYEFEGNFGYTETDDQLRCTAEIKKDMETPVPMDRLLCGDVGYGKTEVALRACMKCVLSGKQAAILVPTTVLAQQHYQTAVSRFFGFPVTVEVLSRFTASPASVLRDLESGKCDLVVGTHRLLSKDVRFKDLGLLVVDEEQRFGVTHKEHIKELSQGVDVLTLSATPIPRTLNMALAGIRDMSMIEEPPGDRLPVSTFVLEHDWEVVAEAITRELLRGGQVYYLHNRIDDIERTAKKLEPLLPEGTTIAVAHGRMDKAELQTVMEAVSAGEVQVLVCTTIIEAGIDIPNVNTLIIEDADCLGLAQLHQIRGRVGRSSRRASAYLTFRRDKVLTEIAEKRLSAIRDFAEFGSGIKIAMRDLEIRGAGNLLGAEQSGHMHEVGYDMYMKLLEEAVLEARGVPAAPRADCSADLAVAASIPDSYIPAQEQRMDIYRRIALIRTEEQADDLTDELIDRFGDPPPGVNTLIQVALLRGEAGRAGITDISQKNGRLIFVMKDLDVQTLLDLCSREEYKGILKAEPGDKPTVSLKIISRSRITDQARKFVRSLEKE